MTGAQAAKVTGRFRGKGRYVSAWVRWDVKSKEFPEWKTIKVAESFANKRKITKYNDD